MQQRLFKNGPHQKILKKKKKETWDEILAYEIWKTINFLASDFPYVK